MDYTLYTGFLDPDADRSILKDKRGAAKTQSLFLESQPYRLKKKYPPVYSLTEEEREGLPSAYQIYMHSTDEYEAAMKLVGSMRHWRKLCALKWFMEGIKDKMFEGLEQWREDMRMRDASEAKAHLRMAAKKGDTSSARKLLDTSKDPADRRGPGAPKKPKPPANDGGRSDRINQLYKSKVGSDDKPG
jgi:hypothetical protein